MKQGQYRNYYVAFLDVLGFKNLVDKKENSCQNILKIYENFKKPITKVYVGDEDNLSKSVDAIKHVNIKVMSDSICFYIDASIPNALFCLLICCGSFQCKLLSLSPPILIRGAVTAGEMYAEGDTTFGPALTEAYLMEEKNAKYPRIIIRNCTLEHCVENTDSLLLEALHDELTYRDADGFYTINYFKLLAAYDDKRHNILKHFQERIKEELDTTIDESIRNKYLYLEKNLEQYYPLEEVSHA